MSAIIKIENTLSGSKKNSSKRFLVFLVLFCICASVGAVTKKNADDEYKKAIISRQLKIMRNF